MTGNWPESSMHEWPTAKEMIRHRIYFHRTKTIYAVQIPLIPTPKTNNFPKVKLSLHLIARKKSLHNRYYKRFLGWRKSVTKPITRPSASLRESTRRSAN